MRGWTADNLHKHGSRKSRKMRDAAAADVQTLQIRRESEACDGPVYRRFFFGLGKGY
jgi:hypothetical protein